MEEIKVKRIKALYGEAKGYLNSLDNPMSSGPYVIPLSVGLKYNLVVDELSSVSSVDYSRSKIDESELSDRMNIRSVKAQMSALTKRLENEYGFGGDSGSAPNIAIFNKNSNSVTVTSYTITELINDEKEEEAKLKLRELEEELNKTSKSWETIKEILAWMMNFSKDLFIKVIPILLEKYHS